MQRRQFTVAAAALAAFAWVPSLRAKTVTLEVVSSGGFAAALELLGPKFTQAFGIPLHRSFGSSMGVTEDAIPACLTHNEPIDVVVMVGYALDEPIKQGKVLAHSKVVLAKSRIGVAVKAGSPRPDISSVDSVKRALLAAKSIAYSASASGVYIQNEMLPRLGIAEQVRGKSHMISTEPVGKVIASGENELGFQQMSELKTISGIDIVGPPPPDLQKIDLYSAGIVTYSRHQAEARKLLAFLSSREAAPIIAATGQDPIVP
ncbi:hypothetical protein WK53_33920 [Burkholderia ubonensis]|uniref:ABC transporter substrate-binding protein n=2 Tax=Burkholderia ubonensis TaxID=101571 RepID=A0AAW3NE40_9BURK|nr:hypothetical protein WK53_33920 [Burkholderia ubonensis]